MVCQHGVYLEKKMAGSNVDGFKYVNGVMHFHHEFQNAMSYLNICYDLSTNMIKDVLAYQTLMILMLKSETY